MSGIQQAMNLLISTFDKYASKDGDCHTLTKAELKDMLENEFGTMLTKTSDKASLDRIFNDLDANKDNSVDFKEYVILVCSLTVLCHEYFMCKK